MKTPIHHTFGPLADRRQMLRSFEMLLVPFRWSDGKSSIAFRNELQRKFGDDVTLFGSGREGLLALFQALPLRPGDEVIVQAYTCVVVPNAIHAAGAIPVYVDIEKDTLNLDVAAVREAITPRTRAIICQHTFGIPSDTAALRKLCDEHRLFFIEDCAHVLPDERGPGQIGGAGDALLLSFGRDKAISGVSGGAVVSRRADVSERLRAIEDRAVAVPRFTMFRYLLYPHIYCKARFLYRLGLGRLYAAIIGRLRMFVPIVTAGEKHGHMSPILHRMPNACAFLALDQLRRLRSINDHRRMLTQFYLAEFQKRGWPVLGGIREDLPLQKFPTFVKEAEKIRRSLKPKNIFLDDGWTSCVVCPASVNISDTGYVLGEDPEAEAVCEEILSLPTHPGMTLTQADSLLYTLADAGMPRQ